MCLRPKIANLKDRAVGYYDKQLRYRCCQDTNKQLNMKTYSTSEVGIDDMTIYLPKLYFSIQALAEARGLEYEKLSQGLGLFKMAIPDVHEDTATMAATAIAELIDKNQINPKSIGRIYLGTESALDGSKPTATYALNMLEQRYAPAYGKDCFLNCDVVDMTFACVGGVDALHSTLDWIRGDEARVGIVVTSDFAKYELNSTGEYTQGAGAIALLLKSNPRLLSIHSILGVATKSEHDFYKPVRPFTKHQLLEEALHLAGIKNLDIEQLLKHINESLSKDSILQQTDDVLYLHKETPIFDGPFSNATYQHRIREALQNFRDQAIAKGILAEDETILERWSRLIFHLPYAFHGKRIFTELFILEKKLAGTWEVLAAQLGIQEPSRDNFESDAAFEKVNNNFFKAVSQTSEYKELVKTKMEKAQQVSGEVGNMYTGSIFLALMGTLEADFQLNTALENKKIGFFSYGSGSKSKVFEALVQPTWKEVVAKFQLRAKLDQRVALDDATYEKLHRKQLNKSVLTPDSFALVTVGKEGNTLGARYYTAPVMEIVEV